MGEVVEDDNSPEKFTIFIIKKGQIYLEYQPVFVDLDFYLTVHCLLFFQEDIAQHLLHQVKLRQTEQFPEIPADDIRCIYLQKSFGGFIDRSYDPMAVGRYHTRRDVAQDSLHVSSAPFGLLVAPAEVQVGIFQRKLICP